MTNAHPGYFCLLSATIRKHLSGLLLVAFLIFDASCSKDDPSPSTLPTTAAKPLTFFEEQLVGKWSRYHAYDGSTDYYIFKANRTGCEWTEENGGGRTSENNFTSWSLNETTPVEPNVFRIIYLYVGSTTPYESSDEFHYVENELWRGGYDNLVNTPSTTSLDCK